MIILQIFFDCLPVLDGFTLSWVVLIILPLSHAPLGSPPFFGGGGDAEHFLHFVWKSWLLLAPPPSPLIGECPLKSLCTPFATSER